MDSAACRYIIMLVQIMIFKLERAINNFPLVINDLIGQQLLDLQLVAIQQRGLDTTISMQMNFSDLHIFLHLCLQQGLRLEFVDRHFARISLAINKPNVIPTHSNNDELQKDTEGSTQLS